MDDETSLLLKTPWVMMANPKQMRRRNTENDDYSSIASSIASTAISSSFENTTNADDDDDDDDDFPDNSIRSNQNNSTTTDEFLLMDIDEAIDRLGMGRFQFQILIACGLCFASDAMEYLLLSYLGVILRTRWNLSERESDFISAVVFLGALVGTLTLSPLGDKWGRKIVFATTSSIISIFGISSAFCTSYSQILVVRFLVGVGIGGLTVPYDTLGEFMPNSRRGKNMLSTSFFWISAGLMVPLFAWLTVGTKNSSNEEASFASWRSFVMLCSLPSVVSTALGIWIVPESPRWLLTRGKHEQSLGILRQAAAKNGKDPYLVFPRGVRLVDTAAAFDDATKTRPADQKSTVYRIQEGGTATHESIPQPEEESEALACIESAPTTTKIDRMCTICLNPEWRKISLMLGVQWYGLTFMYYGAIMAVSIVFSNIHQDIDGNESSSNGTESLDFDYWALLISSSAEIVGLTLAILLVDRVGRVPTQVWGYSLGGFCLLLLGILDFYKEPDVFTSTSNVSNPDEEDSPRNYLIVFAFLSRMFIMGATAITWVHTAELLPTRFRATGHGLANALGRVGGMTCPFIVSRDNSLRTIGIVMFSVGVVTAISVQQLPETVGKALGKFGVSLASKPAKARDHEPVDPETSQVPSSNSNNNGNTSTSSGTVGAEGTTIGKFNDQQYQTNADHDKEADERSVSSFEII